MIDREDSELSDIKLLGKDQSILKGIQKEIELKEKVYDIPNDKVDYLAGLKFQNITNFKEKAQLASLYLHKNDEQVSKLKAVGN